jgi:soluble lytic murein transglycosylase-like protein
MHRLASTRGAAFLFPLPGGGGRGVRAPLVVAWVLVALVAPGARAEIAVLSNGTTFKISSYRVEGESVVLALKEGGEVGAPAALVMGFVPDEVIEEIAAAVSEAAAAEPGGGDVRSLAIAAARRHGLDPDLVLAVVAVESAFRPDAVSPKGAQGLMQLMPRTAASLGVQDALDPAQNLDGGARHLRFLVDLYGGDLRQALAAYNAGQGAVKRHGGVPPYRETREYVKKVLKRYEARKP